MSQFFEELKRRNVFRVAVFYVVASWLVLQIGDLLFDLMGLPDWSLRIVLGVLILAFPIVVIFAWAFEITPEGIKRERDVDRSQSITTETGRKLELTTIVLLVVVGGLVIYQQFVGAPEAPEPTALVSEPAPAEPATPAPAAASDGLTLAVLPFRNISGDDENEYFVDGLSEELMNMLAGIESLRVAARTSAFSFKGKDVKVQQIGEELQVGHVLEGSVRKAGNRIRVSAQLIQTADGFQLWSETFDRELDDVFALQDEIARNVADALRVELLGEAASPDGPDPAAFDRYLAGRFHIRQLAAGSAQRAAQEFKRAVEIDPDYAEAWAGLADSYAILEEYAGLPLEESIALQRDAIERAEALNPELPEVIVARATAIGLQGGSAEVLARYETALKLRPNDSDLLLRAADAAEALGRINRLNELVRRALDVDPLNLQVQTYAAQLFASRGDFETARARIRELEEEWPNDPNVQDIALTIEFQAGDAVGAMRHLERLHELRPRDVFAHNFIHLIWKSTGRDDYAGRWLELAGEVAPDSRYVLLSKDREFVTERRWEERRRFWAARLEAGDSTGFASGRLASTLARLGDLQGAIDHFERSLAEQGFDLDQPASRPQLFPISWLAWLYQQTGQEEKAAPLVAKLEAYLDLIEREGYLSCPATRFRAEVEMLQGRPEGAIEYLDESIDRGCWGRSYLETTLHYGELQDSPEFLAVVERSVARAVAVRESIEAAGTGLPPGA